MSWLEDTLRFAEKNNESVFIIGHIPPGSNYFNSEASRRYNVLIDRFSNIISGQFFGHAHNDEFKIINEYYDEEKIAGIVHTCGSLTTNAFRNPGFRVYNMDDNNVLKDYSLLYFNVTKANVNENVLPQFEIGYTASELFNLTYLNEFDKYQTAVDKIMSDEDYFERISFIYFGFGEPHVDLVTGPGGKMIRTKSDDEDLKFFLWCRFKEGVFENYVKCMGKRKSWDGFDSAMSFVEKLSGKWHTRKDFI
jgi:hypothetical protein